MDKTSLYDWHRSNSNNIIPFSGYLLPVYYTSIVDEHLSVRKKAGLFDVSHMGELIVSGKDSGKFIQSVTVNDISKFMELSYEICNDTMELFNRKYLKPILPILYSETFKNNVFDPTGAENCWGSGKY